jgi:hypothetical protein
MGEDKKQEILDKVGSNRRDFLKKVLAGAAFATPVMASFSIDGLWAGVAPTQSFASSYCHQAPSEYNGPRKFKAHFSDQQLKTRLNGQADFKISLADDHDHDGHDPNPGDDDDHSHPVETARLETFLSLSGNAQILDAYIAVDSQRVVGLQDKKGNIFPSTHLSYLCDFTQLLEAMAADRAYVVVAATSRGEQFYLTGRIQPQPGASVRISPV